MTFVDIINFTIDRIWEKYNLIFKRNSRKVQIFQLSPPPAQSTSGINTLTTKNTKISVRHSRKPKETVKYTLRSRSKNNWYFLLVSRWHFRLCQFVTKLRLCSFPASPEFLHDTPVSAASQNTNQFSEIFAIYVKISAVQSISRALVAYGAAPGG